jgi:quinoprotein glucose dehydrogenase
MRLIPRREFRRLRKEGSLNGVEAEFTAQSGTPYGMARFDLFNAGSGFHCLEGPWSTLVAVDLATGETLWEAPAGRRPGIDSDHPAADWGYFANGGPIVTSGGLVFLATQYDRMLRAYDLRDGGVVWRQELPAGPQATPMIYQRRNDTYVVLTLGGLTADGGRGDHVIAYRLPGEDDG